MLPNVFDDAAYSMAMVDFLGKLESNHIAYAPITPDYIRHLISFAEVLDLAEPLEYDTVFYRGCSTIERNGVNGIVSVTSDFKIAEQFSRGTILTMHVPKGTQNLNVNAIRPYQQRNKDFEQEFLLPPCTYEIVRDKEIKSGKEPNNPTGRTRCLQINVSPLNLLEEFLNVMENPSKEFLPLQDLYRNYFNEAKHLLESYLSRDAQRKRKMLSNHK